jgi:cytochrome c-type biogenesis protein CcmH/NrfF
MISICPNCKQNRIESSGCTLAYLLIDGVQHKRLTGGYEKGKEFGKDLTKTGEALRCPDCGATEGNIHHFGCENEICPIHRTSILGCDCEEAVPL